MYRLFVESLRIDCSLRVGHCCKVAAELSARTRVDRGNLTKNPRTCPTRLRYALATISSSSRDGWSWAGPALWHCISSASLWGIVLTMFVAWLLTSVAVAGWDPVWISDTFERFLCTGHWKRLASKSSELGSSSHPHEAETTAVPLSSTSSLPKRDEDKDPFNKQNFDQFWDFWSIWISSLFWSIY